MFLKEKTTSSTPVLTSSRRLHASKMDITENNTDQPTTLDHLRLFHAFHHGHVKELQKLLRTKLSPNEIDGDGNSMLHLAIENGDYDMAELLLQDERCDVDIRNEIGQSPLVTAVIMSDLEMVKLLVKAGADLDLQDISGKTPLLHALGDCSVDVAEYLINHGCDVNVVDSLGQSALYSVINALDFKCIKIVKKLLKSGYTLQKDKVWMEEEGLDVQVTHSTNVVTKLFRKIAGKLHKLKVHQITTTTLSSPQQTGIHPIQQRILKIYG